jgi:ABC-type Mn2+/Zn2+ transport system ATPase subunit
MEHTIIDIDRAVVSYREDIALRGVSLSVEWGEFVGIVGPNGAGKTTLLTVINGMGKLVQGKVQVLGYSLGAGNGHAVRKKIGYVPQAANIDPRMPMSVREVVMVGRYGTLGLFHMPDKDDWRLVDKALEVVGMTHVPHRPIGNLSGASSSG